MQFYHSLLSDRTRIEAFRSMIQSTVGPGKVVVEVGAGLGTYSIFAAQAGARRVYAIESDPIIHVAQQVSQINGFDDRVEFVRGSAPAVELPERADVLIFEDFPTRLLDRETVQMLRKCAAQYLKPSGLVLPGWARLMAAPVRSAERWGALFPFGPEAFEAFGLDWAPATGYAENQPESVQFGFDVVVAKPATIGEVPIHPSPDPSRLGGSATFHPQAGAIHGIAYWFDLWTGDGRWLSNAPGSGGAWGQLFLPFRTPLDVQTGVPLEVGIEVFDTDDGAPGWLSWDVRAGEAVRRGHEFAGHPASLEDLYGPLPRAAEVDGPAPPLRADDERRDGLTPPLQ